MKIEAPGQFFLSTVISKWWIVFDTRPAILKTFSVPFFKLTCMMYDLIWVLKTKDLISLIVVRLQAIYSSLIQNNYLRAAKGKPPIYYYWVNIFSFRNCGMRIFVLSKTLTGTRNGSLPTVFSPLQADKRFGVFRQWNKQQNVTQVKYPVVASHVSF